MTLQEARDVWHGMACGCGRPEVVLACAVSVLAELDRKHEYLMSHAVPSPEWDAYYTKHEARMRTILGGKPGPYWLVLYMLDTAGLTEHGGNVSGAWLTPRGKEFVEAVREHGPSRVASSSDWEWEVNYG